MYVAVMMMIAPNSRARKGRTGEAGGSMEEYDGRRKGMLTHAEQHVAPCVNGIEWESIVLSEHYRL